MQFVLLVYSACHLSLVEGFKVMAGTYTTDFPLAENPISEGGNWINGGVVGIDWTNVATINGYAHGTENGTISYNDSTALLAGTWGSDQTVQATVRVGTRPTSGNYKEVELRLRSSLSAHNCTGYECNFSMAANSNNPYAQIVRWNGAVSNFTYLGSISIPQINSGDVVKAVASVNTITTYVNGTALFSVTDGTYMNGSPGIGFYLQGSGKNNSGFTNFTATDGIVSPTTTTLTSSQNPSLPGQSVIFSANVTETGGTPTGTVQFKTNGFAFGSTVNLSSGSASSNPVSTLPHGSNAITAEYSGDTSFLTSTGSLSQVIDTPPVGGAHYLGATLNTTLSVSSNVLANLDYDADGDPLTITAVSGTSTNGPSGNVTLSGGMVNYTPATGYVGVDQFTYTISDGYPGGTATSTANVTVRLGNATSVLNPPSASSGTVTLSGFGIPSKQYDIQRSTDPTFPSYTTLGPVTAAANGVIIYTDNNPNSPSYYRLAVHPTP